MNDVVSVQRHHVPRTIIKALIFCGMLFVTVGVLQFRSDCEVALNVDLCSEWAVTTRSSWAQGSKALWRDLKISRPYIGPAGGLVVAKLNDSTPLGKITDRSHINCEWTCRRILSRRFAVHYKAHKAYKHGHSFSRDISHNDFFCRLRHLFHDVSHRQQYVLFPPGATSPGEFATLWCRFLHSALSAP